MKNVEDFYPLSPMQQGMLFHSLLAPDSGVYVGQLSCVLCGDLDSGAFERAWQRVVERHPILRTTFVSADLKEPIQVVHRSVTLPLEQHDWRDLPPHAQAAQLDAWLHADQQRGFKLTAPPLLRLTLIRLSSASYQFIWTYHHLLFDGWSLPLILHEVFALYQAFARLPAGTTPSDQQLGLPLVRPFRSYIAWLKKQNLAEAETFWRQKLAGVGAPTSLVVDHAPDAAAESPGSYAELGTFLSTGTTSALHALARSRRLTLNTLVQGAWALLLSRYNGEHDVVFGATVSGRPPELPGAEQMIGLLINTLPVRVRCTPDTPIRAWLAEIQAQQLELRQYEWTPLVQIQGWSEIPRSLPLFESILVFENTPVASAVGGEAGRLNVAEIHSVQQTNYPLTVVAEPGEQLNLRIAYDGLRFDQLTIKRILGHLQTILEYVAVEPHARIADIPLLTASERQQIAAWNRTETRVPHERCVHALFAEQAQRTPNAVAVRCADQSLSYAALDRRSNQLANYLRTLDVGPETLVGLCVEPSLELVVGVLGILKAGAAYVPLEPTYPADRLHYMISDAQLPVILTQQTIIDTTSLFVKHPTPDTRHLIRLDTDWQQIAQQPHTLPDVDVTPNNLAYVIYTSGSTGRPKGTLLEHRGLCNLAHVVIDWFAITPDSRVLQFAAFSFDASVSEIVMALLAGATLVLAPRATLTSIPDLLNLIRSEAITTVTLPPSLLHVLQPDDLPLLETVVSAGESCSWEIAERWGAGRRFLNGYGPTEGSVAASYYRFEQRLPHTMLVPIGQPIANVHMYLLDHEQRPVPIGVPGEIYIGGVGVARGYLNRPDLTAERFVQVLGIGDQGSADHVPDTQRPAPGTRFYRTGDLARYLADGTIEYLGRIDDQIKLRGFRIELGEIEAALSQHPDLDAAVVVVREDVPGERRLVAYVVPMGDEEMRRWGDGDSDPRPPIPDPRTLRTWLAARLPEYMIPSVFVQLDRLPLTPNGKIDRRALPAPDKPSSPEQHVSPRTPEEELVAGVWAQVLGVARVGIDDSFFELGGHSTLR